ncbi:MAG: methyltransferase domain-containing protein [Dehalococcoidia bacterium]
MGIKHADAGPTWESETDILAPVVSNSWQRSRGGKEHVRRHVARWHDGRVRLVKRALKGRRLPGAGLVLDVAGGDGFYSALVASLTGGRLVVQDIGASGTRESYAAGYRAVRGDIRRLPFADGAADVTLAFEVLGYLDPSDAPSVIEELHRVTKPGGILLLSTPNRYSLESWKGLARYLVDGTVWNAGGTGSVTIYSRGALVSLLRPHFSIEAWYGYSLAPPLRNLTTGWTYAVTANPLLARLSHKLFVVARRR